ncbi:MAG: GTPase domain-containing protein [Candidatus Brocadiaceae bacterium]|jgi:signal recognition particle receptor subunit beta
MPSIDVKKRRIDSKIVYYGPGRSGKTENLKYIRNHLDEEHRGRLASLPTKADPSLHIDVLPVRFGKIIGFQTIFHLCAGPGQAFSNNTRKLLLRDTDGIVFVADSDPRRREANLDSLAELRQNLTEHGLHLRTVPHVVQYCKRDLEDAVSVAELRADLNTHGVPDFSASTETGEGVMETLRAAVRAVSNDLKRRL